MLTTVVMVCYHHPMSNSPATTFVTTATAHTRCEDCDTHAALAATIARVTGSTGSTHSDDEHSATVERNTTSHMTDQHYRDLLSTLRHVPLPNLVDAGWPVTPDSIYHPADQATEEVPVSALEFGDNVVLPTNRTDMLEVFTVRRIDAQEGHRTRVIWTMGAVHNVWPTDIVTRWVHDPQRSAANAEAAAIASEFVASHIDA